MTHRLVIDGERWLAAVDDAGTLHACDVRSVEDNPPPYRACCGAIVQGIYSSELAEQKEGTPDASAGELGFPFPPPAFAWDAAARPLARCEGCHFLTGRLDEHPVWWACLLPQREAVSP